MMDSPQAEEMMHSSDSQAEQELPGHFLSADVKRFEKIFDLLQLEQFESICYQVYVIIFNITIILNNAKRPINS